MQVNGKQLTEKETLNLYKEKLKYLKKQVLTESVHNDIVHLNKMIRLIEIPMKYTELRNKQIKVRTLKENDKIEKKLNEIDNNYFKEFNITIYRYLKSKQNSKVS
jgi:hypothetical protein